MKALIIRSKLIVFTVLSVVGLYFLWDPVYLIYTAIAFFLFSTVGHEIGLHRYYSHQSFTCNKFVESFLWLMVFLGGISDPLSYARRHARHHRYSDTTYDNLQPVKHPVLTWWGFGSLRSTPVDVDKMPISSRLANSKFHKFVFDYYFILYYSTLLTCFAVDVKLAFYVLILASTLTHHIGGIASVVTHKLGYRNFATQDHSTNCAWFHNIFGIGGLHNNHHRFPYAYTTKVNNNEVDPVAWIIKNLLATTVRTK